MEKPSPATIQTALDELDDVIAEAEKTLQMARECHFSDAVAGITEDIRGTILPGLVLLLCAADSKQRKRVANFYRRLQKMIA
jgi:hypothetical protein